MMDFSVRAECDIFGVSGGKRIGWDGRGGGRGVRRYNDLS